MIRHVRIGPAIPPQDGQLDKTTVPEGSLANQMEQLLGFPYSDCPTGFLLNCHGCSQNQQGNQKLCQFVSARPRDESRMLT